MLRIFFKSLNVLALLVLLFSCMAAYVDPAEWWQFPFIGFAFPVVLIVNVFFLALWIIKRDSFGLISLVAIVLTWKFIHSTFAINFGKTAQEQGIKLMTWNVKNFDLYNWSHNKETRNKMMALLKKEDPDIICFQEFYTDNGKIFDNVKYLTDTLHYTYNYFQPTSELIKPYKKKRWAMLHRKDTILQQWGVAVFSKFPIQKQGRIDFDNSKNNDCIYADLNIHGKTCRIYSVHFQSLHLGNNDYATIDSIAQSQSAQWNQVKNVLRKMKQAYTKRSYQAETVAESVNQANGLKILCGDFNDVPVSYTYNTAKGNLKDAFVETGKGFGTTYANRLSVFRIDYALFDKSIKINSYKTIQKDLSDHYPVCVTFSL